MEKKSGSPNASRREELKRTLSAILHRNGNEMTQAAIVIINQLNRLTVIDSIYNERNIRYADIQSGAYRVQGFPEASQDLTERSQCNTRIAS